MHCLAWVGLVLALVVSCAAQEPRELVFKVGSVMEEANDVPQCPGTGAMVQAQQVAIERLNNGIGHGQDGLVTKVTLKDRMGQEFRIKFDYVNRVPSACTPEVHNKEVERLIEETKPHFIFGNTHFAFSEAKIVNKAKRLTYHCCFETDELFKLDYPYIFGIANVADQETFQALTSMALEDSVGKLFIFYTQDFRYATQACVNAVEYASSQLRRISSSFELVRVLKYSTANISANPTFFDDVVVEEAVRSGATAVLGCDNTVNGFAIAKAFGRIKDRLKAIFLTLSPSQPSFATVVGPEVAEYILTSASWSPKMIGQRDSFFGTPQQYADAFQAATEPPVLPSFVFALASATVVSLIYALESAFKNCEFVDPANLSVDSLLFDPDAISCSNDTNINTNTGSSVTGYDVVLKSLSSQSMTTFLGNVEFNHFRRNIAHSPVVLQVQNGVPEIVLPLEQASRKLIMPIPHPEEDPHVGVLEEDSFIIVVVVVIVGTLIVTAALALVVFSRRQHTRKIQSLLTIEPEQLQVINLPMQLETTWESGKARMRNTLVALEPLTEIKMQTSTPGETTMPKKSFLMKGKALLGGSLYKADSQDLKSMDMDAEEEVSCHQAVNLQLHDIDVESLQHEDAYTEKGLGDSGSVYRGSANGGSVYRSSGNGQSIQSRSGSGETGRLAVATTPAMPTIQSATLATITSPPSAPMATVLSGPNAIPATKERGCQRRSNPLTQRQVLDLVWRTKNLQHPSVVPVAGVMWALPGMPANIPVLVTECCELGSLTSVLDNQTMELDFLKQLDVTRDLSDALAYLHAQDMNLCPALSKLSGVHLDKHFRAKLRVPLTAFLSMQGNQDPRQDRPQRTRPHDCPELQDVYQFGLGITQLHIGSPSFSSSGILNKPEQMLEGCAMAASTFCALERTRGRGFAELLRECCWIDPNMRPTFTQIVQRLEALEPEVVQVAQHVHDDPPMTGPSSGTSYSRCSRSFPRRQNSNSRDGKISADCLLYELFPAKVADALKVGRSPDPEPFSSVSLFFSDVCGYTDLCSKLAPEEIMDMLHRLYSRFDTACQSLRLFKVETIGDAYMCASNLLHHDPETHAAQMAAFAFSACAAANQVPVCESHPELGNIHIRVGIHAGPVMGAVVGILNRRFCLFGDTVNVASRMESTSTKDMIQCSASFMDLLQQQWPEAAKLAAPQGLKAIKGKGAMYTFFLYPPKEPLPAALQSLSSLQRSSPSGSPVSRRDISNN